ncbi:alpha/beta hydrolase [Pseudonocardia acaciae]|uniref:alpha/beta hydrolase n=1 Tax=Pseudonocardia acaciae TaxID=551276 RepID=UPI000686CEA7|nr:alpha/beta hydrolase [Pseudonocardia acaciae]
MIRVALLLLLMASCAPVANGPPGRLVVALGDPARARHIAVVVPGVGITPETFDDPVRPRRRPYGMARALHELAPDTAVIAWLGYHPPDGPGLDAVTGGRARAGAVALRAFVHELRARSRPGTSIALVCHSYGSTVCGLAAPGLAVDDLVLLASPGVRADSVAALRTPARVWAGTARTDWVRWVPHARLGDLGHGADPADPAFGARPLPTEGVTGHDGYFAAGSPTLRAVAGIVSGGR